MPDLAVYISDSRNFEPARAQWLHAEGTVQRFYIELDSQPEEVLEANRAAFAQYPARWPWLNATGDDARDKARWSPILNEVAPDSAGLCVDIEAPNFARSLADIMGFLAWFGKPLVVSAGGTDRPAIAPLDFQHVSNVGAEVEWMAYWTHTLPDGRREGCDPATAVAELFKPVQLQVGGGSSPAWKYRHRFNSGSWNWLEATGFDPGRGRILFGTAYADATLAPSGAIQLDSDRAVSKADGTPLGVLYGFAAYAKVRYAVYQGQASDAELLAGIAAGRYPGADRRGVGVFDAGNVSDDLLRQIKAVTR